jgi:hypothetical protein
MKKAIDKKIQKANDQIFTLQAAYRRSAKINE